MGEEFLDEVVVDREILWKCLSGALPLSVTRIWR